MNPQISPGEALDQTGGYRKTMLEAVWGQDYLGEKNKHQRENRQELELEWGRLSGGGGQCCMELSAP